MSHLIELIKAFVPHIPSQQELDEAYLSESIDVADVERRMVEIDHRDHRSQFSSLGGALH